MAKNRRQTRKKRTKQNRRQVKRIDVLPDEVLLEIFDFYTNLYPQYTVKKQVEAWQTLVHVCRRWRSLVLGSPRRLKLRLFCTPQTPVKDTVDVWPALPLVIHGTTRPYNPDSDTETDSDEDDPDWDMANPDSDTATNPLPLMHDSMPDSDTDNPGSRTDNVIAALELSNRVYGLHLCNLTDRELEEVMAAMQVPFSKLRHLRLQHYSSDEIPVIPDSFLNGSSPHLRCFSLSGIPFPGVPNLLLSAARLVYLELDDLPLSGYISPEAIVALLSALPKLRIFSLGFQDNRFGPDRESQSLPSPKRSILPALRKFCFKGVTKYLEKLIARIDTPQLYCMDITFLFDIDFDTPRLIQFINSTPTLTALDEAQTLFYDHIPVITLQHRTSEFRFDNLLISVSGRNPCWEHWPFDELHDSSCLRPLSMVEDLYIDHEHSKIVWENEATDNPRWLELLLPFTEVKNLYLPKVFAPSIADTLQGLVGAGITEVLPSLQNIFVEGLEPSGPVQENFGQFVAARQLSDHPIAISVWYKLEDSII